MAQEQKYFGDEVLDLKSRRCNGQLSSFTMVTIYFARFAANAVKSRQVASGTDGASP